VPERERHARLGGCDFIFLPLIPVTGRMLVALAGSARRAAIIVNALDNHPAGRAVWLKEQTDKLVGLGFSVVELDLRSFFGAPDKEIPERNRPRLDQRRQCFHSSQGDEAKRL
jgi:hypothetical protein